MYYIVSKSFKKIIPNKLYSLIKSESVTSLSTLCKLHDVKSFFSKVKAVSLIMMDVLGWIYENYWNLQKKILPTGKLMEWQSHCLWALGICEEQGIMKNQFTTEVTHSGFEGSGKQGKPLFPLLEDTSLASLQRCLVKIEWKGFGFPQNFKKYHHLFW